MRPAANRGQDPPHLPDATLLDDRDVARCVADDLVDGGREHVRRAVVAAAGRAAPAEDDEVRLVLGGQLDDALRRPAPDAHHGPQVHAGRRELEHALEQPARLARAVAPSESGWPSGTSTMDSAVSVPPGSSSAAPMRTRSAAVRGLASGMQDALRGAPPSAWTDRSPTSAIQRSQAATNAGFARSKAAACRSTTVSASSVVISRVSRRGPRPDRSRAARVPPPGVPPAARRAGHAMRHVVDDPRPDLIGEAEGGLVDGRRRVGASALSTAAAASSASAYHLEVLAAQHRRPRLADRRRPCASSSSSRARRPPAAAGRRSARSRRPGTSCEPRRRASGPRGASVRRSRVGSRPG